MSRKKSRAHVVRVKKTHVDKHGNEHVYESVLLRRTYRDGAKVRNQTVANLSTLPEAAIAALDASLKGQALVPAGGDFTVLRALPHGHIAAVAAMARRLGLAALLGRSSRSRDLVWALIVSRVIDPSSSRSTLSRWGDSTLASDLGIDGATPDEVHAAMDWLLARRDAIEDELVDRHLGPDANPSSVALFGLAASRVVGRHHDVAESKRFPHRAKTLTRINYGALTNAAGCPLAVRVFPGDAADPAASADVAEGVRRRFGLDRLVLIGNPDVIPAARSGGLRRSGTGWITVLPETAVIELAAHGVATQLSGLGVHESAEISHPDYPAERLIARRDPALAAAQGRKRDELLVATEALLADVTEQVDRGSLTGVGPIGDAVGRVINRYKLGALFNHSITDHTFSYARDRAGIAAESALDGIYVLRTNVPATQLDTASVVASYRDLSYVERELRRLQTDDLDLRVIHHRLTDRVEAHALMTLLASYLTWHLRQAWSSLTFTAEHPPQPDDRGYDWNAVGAPPPTGSHHSRSANPLRNFRDLLHHLSTLTRNTIRYHDGTEFHTLTEPTPLQRRAFELIDTGKTIPLSITL